MSTLRLVVARKLRRSLHRFEQFGRVVLDTVDEVRALRLIGSLDGGGSSK